MGDQQPSPVGVRMNGFLQDLHIAERHVVKIPQQLIMIAGYIDHVHAMLGLAQDGSYDIVVRLRPEDPLLHFPDVDDVADQVEILAVDGIEEAQQMIGAAPAETQMDIGNPNRAVRQWASSKWFMHPQHLPLMVILEGTS